MTKGNGVNFTLTFSLEKETPGTFRFQESGDKENHKVGTLYIRKSALPKDPPKSLRVTVVEG